MACRVLLLLGAVLTCQGIAGVPLQSSSTTLATVLSNHTEPTLATVLSNHTEPTLATVLSNHTEPTSTTPATREPCTLDTPKNVTMAEIPAGISSGNIVLVELRTHQELINNGKVPGSHSVPFIEAATAFALSPELFKAQYGFPKPSAEKLVFSGRSGGRAVEAWRLTRDFGYCQARVYFGSFPEWSEKKQPIEKITIFEFISN